MTQIILQVKVAAANYQVQTLSWGRFWAENLGGGGWGGGATGKGGGLLAD